MVKKQIKTKVKSFFNERNLSAFIILLLAAFTIYMSNPNLYAYKDKVKFHQNLSNMIKEGKNHMMSISNMEKKLNIFEDKYINLEKKYDDILIKISNLKNQKNITPIILTYFDLIDNIKKNQKTQNHINKLELLISENSILFTKIADLKNIIKQNPKNNRSLQEDFQNLIPELINSEKKTEYGNDLLGKIKYNISKHIIIRKVNFEKEEPSLDFDIHQIEILLKNNDYKRVMYILTKFPNKLSSIIKDFKLDISLKLQFEQLNQEIIRLLKNAN